MTQPHDPAPGRARVARWATLAGLAALAAAATWLGAWWAVPLVLVEGLHPYLAPAWRGLNDAVDRVRADVAPFKRFPGALVGIPLLLLGIVLGRETPESVQWLGDGVGAVIEAIKDAAPYIIFFTLTPAIASTLAGGSAGKFALYVNVAYVATTVVAGILAVLLVIPIFGVRWAGSGATGTAAPGVNPLELVFESAPFIAILVAAGLGLMIYAFRLAGLHEATAFVGGKVIDLVGDLLKIFLPLLLLALGVFIPTKIAEGINRAREAGEVQGTGWVGALQPEVAYFASTGVMVAVLAVWVFGLAYLVMRRTRLPFLTFFRDYFVDVYTYAWSTASSSATIPINLERAGTSLRVRRNVRDFVIPLGATVNLDGTMIGGIVTGVVAAQMVGYTPTVLDLFLILVPLAIITIGVPGVPGGLALVAAPVMTQLLPLPLGTEVAFTAIFVGFNIGLSDQFRTGVNSVDNGILARLFEYWYPTKFARRRPAPATRGEARTPPRTPTLGVGSSGGRRASPTRRA